VRERLKVYRESTQPLVDYYGARPTFRAVNGAQPPDRVAADLAAAIESVRPGARISDIGAAVQRHVEAHGFSVVREFVGHGIGTALHEEPQIANYGPGGRGPRLAEGMVLAIEPMVNAGKAAVKVLSDGWTAVTRDGSLSAHFEHTVVVTRDGCEILTLLEQDAVRAKQLLAAHL
jgi:methionyl aminopeptidase